MKPRNGFSLVELIIALAIIAILISLAVPIYQDYTIRSQVTEGLSIANGAKTAVSDYWSSRGSFPADSAEAGVVAPSGFSGDYVTELRVSNGEIQVTFGPPRAGAPITGRTLTLRPVDVDSVSSLEWECEAPSIPSRYVPSRCR